MFCKNCGKQINDNSKFCMYCGCNVDEKDNIISHDETEPSTNTNKPPKSSCVKWLIFYSLWLTFCIVGTILDFQSRSHPIHPLIPLFVLGFVVPFIIWGIWYIRKKN